ncbi:MAG: hypothetical protein Q8941_10100 [Bacteroidota bacterium]|nr:hypothetical protein [Bacteroidota bacterium]
MNDDVFKGELPGSRAYSEAIAQDMSIMAFYQPGKIFRNFRHVVKKEVNVWVQESNEENELATFSVHYFGRCQFWLHKIEGEWELILPAVNENGQDDAELVRRVGYLLDSLL